MRDIGSRIRHYRLSRYAPANRPLRLGWVWLALGAWLLWVGVASDHSFYQLWKLGHANARQRTELAQVRHELDALQRETSDPKIRRQQAERLLREENGMARPGEIIYRVQDGAAGPSKD